MNLGDGDVYFGAVDSRDAVPELFDAVERISGVSNSADSARGIWPIKLLAVLFTPQSKVEFLHQRPESFAKGAVDRAQDIIGLQVIAVDAAAGADVIAHFFQPGELGVVELDSGGAFSFQPGGEALADVIFERLKRSLGFDGGADEGDKVGESSDSVAFLRRCVVTLLEGAPEFLGRLETELRFLFQLRFEFLQTLFRQTLFEGTAVENLERSISVRWCSM